MVAQRLPMEIVFHIIDSVVDDPAQIYSPDSEVTKTLLSCTRVCRATYAHASNHLRRQCMYIDDEVRLADCVAYLQATNHLVPEYNDGTTEDAKCASPGARLRPITSLYLAPIPGEDNRYFYDEGYLHEEDNFHHEDNLQQTLTRIVKLCTLVGSSLASLILDIPNWALPAWEFDEDTDLGDTYTREPFISKFVMAFSSLTELRDFICVRNSFVSHFEDFLASFWTTPPTNGTHPWDFWPKLQRLSIHEQSADSDFWHSVQKAEHLHTLILVQPALLESGCQKTAFLRTMSAGPHTSEIGTISVNPPRPIKIVVVEYSSTESLNNVRQRLLEGVSNWPLIDPDNLIKLRLCNLPISPTLDAWTRTHVAYTHISSAAVRSDIWSWEGDIIS